MSKMLNSVLVRPNQNMCAESCPITAARQDLCALRLFSPLAVFPRINMPSHPKCRFLNPLLIPGILALTGCAGVLAPKPPEVFAERMDLLPYSENEFSKSKGL